VSLVLDDFGKVSADGNACKAETIGVTRRQRNYGVNIADASYFRSV